MCVCVCVCVCVCQIRLDIPNERVLRSIEENGFEVKRMKEVDKDERGWECTCVSSDRLARVCAQGRREQRISQ
jgi:acetolactate synthase regulatory subunit